jgi:hypothetical protein
VVRKYLGFVSKFFIANFNDICKSVLSEFLTPLEIVFFLLLILALILLTSRDPRIFLWRLPGVKSLVSRLLELLFPN